MSDGYAPDDAFCPDEPTCQYCGKICERTEVVWTGDENSYKCWELWCYCEECKTDTFHPMVKYRKENKL